MVPAAVCASREATTSARAARHLLPPLLLLSAALNVYQIWWGLPLSRPIAREAAHVAKPGTAGGNDARERESVVAWGTDEVAPMGPLVYVKGTFIDGSWFHKYPAFHFMLLSAAYAPAVGYFILSGQLSLAQSSDVWPYGFKDPASSLSILLLIARLVSALMGTAVVGLMYFITERLFGAASAVFAALIVAVSFPFIYYSHTSNLDVPYLFWFVLGCTFYLRLFMDGRTRDYLLFAVCMALAVATKDQAYALLPFFPMMFVLGRMGQRPAIPRQTRMNRSPGSQWGLALLTFTGTYVIAANVLNNWSGYLRHLRHIAGHGSAPYQEFPNTPSGHIALLSKTISLLAQSLDLPLFVVCVVGVLWSFRRFPKTTIAVLAPAISYYIFFLSVILYGYPRFLLPFVLVSAIFGGHLLADLWAVPPPASWLLRSAIVAVLAYSLGRGASVGWLLRQDPRYGAEQWFRAHVPANAVIEAYGPSQYLPRFPDHPRARGVNLEGYVEEAFRKRAPDYVVLAHAYYKRITEDKVDDFDQEEFLEHLWHGELGYRNVADFSANGLGAPNLIPGLNSRIVIFERKD